MTHMRGQLSARNEQVTREAIADLGLAVHDFGQALLTPAVREMLRGVPDPQRWTQDFMVRTPRGRSVYVDAKYSFPKSLNHSIEMRSLLVAGNSTLPTFYVCSFNQAGFGGTFSDIVVLHYQEVPVIGATAWPCCDGCREKFLGTDPMRAIPERCPKQQRGNYASGTPYFVVQPPFRSLSADMFDIEPYFAGLPVLRHWDRNVVVREGRAMGHAPVVKG